MRGAPPPTPAADLARRAATTPHALALAWDGGRLTFRELDHAAQSMADRFNAAGVPPGRPVTLCVSPGPDAVAALFGLWRGGYVATPLHEKLTGAEVAHAHQIVNSALHIDNSSLHSGAVAARSGRVSPASGQADLGADPDIIALLLTSGSSGAPKALGFTRDAFAASAAAVTRRLALTPDDRWGLSLSLGHIGGLSLVVRAVMNGSAVRLWPSFDADAVARAIIDGEVTHLAIVPVMLRRLLECRRFLQHLKRERMPGTLRCVLVGGAAASRTLLDQAWNAGLPVATTWGMTETASQVATAPPDLARRLPGTVGRPLRSLQVRQGAAGTLEVRGPTLASVVIRRPAAAPDPLPTDAHGWFTTQDLGHVDEDGLVWIEGRQDAIIVSGGLNVSPREVERVIEALPGAAEAVVFGVPDEEWGEVVVAVVETDRSAVTAADIDRHCRNHLARGRCPSHIVVVDELPRTWTGKVMRSRVAERYGPRAGSPPAASLPPVTSPPPSQ